MDTVSAVAGKLGSLLLLVAAGYIVSRKKIVPDGFMDGISSYLSMIVLPLFFVTNLQIDYSAERLQTGIRVFLVFILVAFVAIGIGYLTAWIFRVKGADKGIWVFGNILSNHAFVGFPIFQLLYGDEGMFYAVFVNAAMNVVAFTLGVLIMGIHAENVENKKSIKQLLLTPMNAGVVLGILLFLFNIRLPAFLIDTCDMLTNGMSGLAMLFVGAVLSRYPIEELFKSPKSYAMAGVRLLVIPAVIYFVMIPFTAFVGSNAAAVIVLSVSLPVGSMIVPMAAVYSDDPTSAARYVSLSTIFCILTVPLVTYFIV